MNQIMGKNPKLNYIFAIFTVLMGILFIYCSSAPEEITYGTGEWNSDQLGNHRAVIETSGKSDIYHLHIPWRRKDKNPQDKNVIIIDAQTSNKVRNLFRIRLNNEYGDFLFQPLTDPGRYQVYYMPYVSSGRSNYPAVRYQTPENTASKDWLKKHGLNSNYPERINLDRFKKAALCQIQSIDAFNSFYPMEVIATKKETAQLVKDHPLNYLLFPEDRRYPIRMKRFLPYKWIKSGPRNSFKAEAFRGEYYTFQIGVFAVTRTISDIRMAFSDLTSGTGDKIPATSLTCFNLEGIDWQGKAFQKNCDVLKGQVQPMWIGIDIPEHTAPGDYHGTITLQPRSESEQKLQLNLKVKREIIKERGGDHPSRHSRLRWLNSRIAFNDKVIPPFTPLTLVTGKYQKIGILGRSVLINPEGFPERITSYYTPEVTGIDPHKGKEILGAPIRLVIRDRRGNILKWITKGITKIIKTSPGEIQWRANRELQNGEISLNCQGSMEFDGFLFYKIILKSKKKISVGDIQLQIPLKKDSATYLMGLGRKGGIRPSSFKWKWNVKKNQDSVWIGAVNAGLQVSFRDNHYQRPLNTNFYHSKPLIMPVAWENQGRGGIDIREMKNGIVRIESYSGERVLRKNQELHFYFYLLITPFKPLDSGSHWQRRYYHRYDSLDKIMAAGANIINVHHATPINPYINYPFLVPGKMKEYIHQAHEKNIKVKIYNTIRELSNKAPEIFALFSLGNEIISSGPGGGFSWLQEHLPQNYISAWFVPRLKDAAVINSGMSRWHNYYLEGINWLVKNVGIDGLYIDDLAFDRTTMKRLRRILDQTGTRGIIDLHSANQYNPRDGYANSANLYLEHFPYIDRLWFGEYFNPDESADFWLTEMSGIPFGLMGEMLQDGGNKWRGMLFGMTPRLPWAGNPRPIWKIWDEFKIQKSRMIGFWSSRCPVRTSHKKILAPTYVIKGEKVLIALGSWVGKDTRCRLTLNWKSLGLKPERISITAPEIKDFQPFGKYQGLNHLLIQKNKGLILLIQKKM